jgi:benzoyl-CoA reductase/2-hydroxyglutaryl-CoA dehydratase subunit BcrC/BadD/HgdB
MDRVKYIGYTCSYTPVEILSATGYQPYRLMHGTVDLARRSDDRLRIDACPLVKANVSFIRENRDRFTALVGTTGCDMARRMFDVLDHATGLPLFLVNNPRTDSYQMYSDEIDWLTREMQRFSRKEIDDRTLKPEIERWEEARDRLRDIDEQRAALPSRVSIVEFQRSAECYLTGRILDIPRTFKREPADKPRVYLLGSPLVYEAVTLLELFESRLRIVGDFNCGLSRILGVRVQDPCLEGLKQAYYYQPPCVFKRPNKGFYDRIGARVRDLRCAGVVAYTLDYCDCHEFELKKIERILNLPLLKVRSDLSMQNLSQLKVRIEAFAEMIGASCGAEK